ncbi:MAG TPA: NADH-quinone oxidoreductase subunit H [Acidobacteriota bacterium]|nr:NADH-quinone oxidoreductase subunit H [Acidobacteriota bacterium]
MTETALWSIVKGIANTILVLAAAPFFEGLIRKVTARIQSRQGPPLWQPYLDILKLLGKEDIESGESPRVQRLGAYLSLAGVLTLAWFVPMGASAPLVQAGDAIVVIYLLTLCGVSTLLAGLAAGSTYSVVGVSREMMAMLTLEPLLAVAVIIGAVEAGSLRLDGILEASIYSLTAWPLAGLLMMVILLFSLQAFVGRVPFDIAEAETEVMEGPLMEYSGPKLGLFKYAQMSKLFVYCALIVGLFFPWGSDWPYPLALMALLAKIAVLVLLVTVVGATHARYRIDQAIRYYATLFVLSLVALTLALAGF